MYIRGLSPLARELKANAEFLKAKNLNKKKMAFKSSSMTPYKKGGNRRKVKLTSPYGPMVLTQPPRSRRVKGSRPSASAGKRLFMNVRTSGAGSTRSAYYTGKKTVPKALYALYQQNQEYSDEVLRSMRLTSLFGKQAVYCPSYNYSPDIKRYFLTIPQAPFASDLYTGKLYIKDTKVTMTFTNQDLATCYVKMYQISPRFHIDNTSGARLPIPQWDSGFESQTGSGTANDDYRDAYASPFVSQAFSLFYKVDKVICFELGQGQSHFHTMHYNINKAAHGQITSVYDTFRGITSFNMVVASGTPINDLTNRLLVSTSSCALDIVERVTTQYTYAAAQKTRRYYTNSLGTITTSELVSVGAGIVVNEDEA